MCGRFTLKTSPDQWGQLLLPLIDQDALNKTWRPRYNIAPTQQILAIASGKSLPELPVLGRGTEGDERWLSYFRWGLVPGWAADLATGNSMINARSESLREKRSFKGPLAARRCLILADGYYEWQKTDSGKKRPYWIHRAGGGLFYLAGLWEVNTKATGHPVVTCTIITTAASEDLQHLHDRMPVVLVDDRADRWLEADCDATEAHEMLGPAPERFFQPLEVSTHVNNPRHEDPDCVAPVG